MRDLLVQDGLFLNGTAILLTGMTLCRGLIDSIIVGALRLHPGLQGGHTLNTQDTLWHSVLRENNSDS